MTLPGQADPTLAPDRASSHPTIQPEAPVTMTFALKIRRGGPPGAPVRVDRPCVPGAVCYAVGLRGSRLRDPERFPTRPP